LCADRESVCGGSVPTELPKLTEQRELSKGACPEAEKNYGWNQVQYILGVRGRGKSRRFHLQSISGKRKVFEKRGGRLAEEVFSLPSIGEAITGKGEKPQMSVVLSRSFGKKGESSLAGWGSGRPAGLHSFQALSSKKKRQFRMKYEKRGPSGLINL